MIVESATVRQHLDERRIGLEFEYRAAGVVEYGTVGKAQATTASGDGGAVVRDGAAGQFLEVASAQHQGVVDYKIPAAVDGALQPFQAAVDGQRAGALDLPVGIIQLDGRICAHLQPGTGDLQDRVGDLGDAGAFKIRPVDNEAALGKHQRGAGMGQKMAGAAGGGAAALEAQGAAEHLHRAGVMEDRVNRSGAAAGGFF